MRTLFSDDIFGSRGFAPFNLAQATTRTPETAYSIFDDIFGLIGLSEDDFNALLNKVPEEDMGVYRDRFRKCKELKPTSTESISCFRKLYKDIKEASDAVEAAATRPGATRPPEAGFPILPVGIGVLAATGLIVLLATR